MNPVYLFPQWRSRGSNYRTPSEELKRACKTRRRIEELREQQALDDSLYALLKELEAA